MNMPSKGKVLITDLRRPRDQRRFGEDDVDEYLDNAEPVIGEDTTHGSKETIEHTLSHVEEIYRLSGYTKER